jgi:hypothetical protein
MIFCARATRGHRKDGEEAARCPSCSFDARSKGQPWPLSRRDVKRNWKALARAHGTSRRASGWAGEKACAQWKINQPPFLKK